MSRERTVWTRQHPAVLEGLERCGKATALSSIQTNVILSPFCKEIMDSGMWFFIGSFSYIL